jgi:hypothetical protein
MCIAHQEAVAMGGMWLEAFSGDVEDGLPNGVGTTKFAEHAFVELDESAMVNPVRPSAVAAYLHDDMIIDRTED